VIRLARPAPKPEPTSLHLDFIRASEEEAEARLSKQRKQLEAVAAAQAEREKALHQAEEAQRKRATMARVRNIAFVIVSILAVLAGYLYWNAIQQQKIAEEQRKVAEAQTTLAEAQTKLGKRPANHAWRRDARRERFAHWQIEGRGCSGIGERYASGVQFQGSRASIRLIGWSAMRARMSRR